MTLISFRSDDKSEILLPQPLELVGLQTWAT